MRLSIEGRVRLAVAARPDLPPEVSALLAHDRLPGIRARVCRPPPVPENGGE